MKNLVRPLTRCLVLLLICCPAVHARLKDSETESRERYGSPLRNAFKSPWPMVPGGGEKSYDFEGWRITAAYHRGTTVAIKYMRLSKPGESVRELKDYEIKAILDAEAGGGQWKPAGTINPAETLSKMVTNSSEWKTTNGRTAKKVATTITLELPEAEAIRRAAKAQIEKERKESVPAF